MRKTFLRRQRLMHCSVCGLYIQNTPKGSGGCSNVAVMANKSGAIFHLHKSVHFSLPRVVPGMSWQHHITFFLTTGSRHGEAGVCCSLLGIFAPDGWESCFSSATLHPFFCSSVSKHLSALSLSKPLAIADAFGRSRTLQWGPPWWRVLSCAVRRSCG